MALTVLTQDIWDSYTPQQQEEYRTRLFITRRETDYPWPLEADDTLENHQAALLAYYRITGFPYYDLDVEEQTKKFKSLVKYDHSKIFRDNNVNQTMHGLSLAWTYFHHMWAVKCGEMKTATEVFNDDTLFMKAIVKRMKWGTYVNPSGIRKALRSFSGTQTVSNFRPTAAAAIYHHFLPAEGGVTWDMSCGFGGRLLGAMTCDRVRKYIGTDPGSQTFEGLQKMRDVLLPILYKLQPKRPQLIVELNRCGSEDFVVEPETIDLCFTSPPYFDTEKYSEEETQSYKRFPSKDEWLNGFMKLTLTNCFIGLKPTGYLVVNIANVKSYPTLNDDFVAMAESVGFRLENTANLLLSKMMGTRVAGGDAFKTEPIFIFRKIVPCCGSGIL
jgi:hypothetical protein